MNILTISDLHCPWRHPDAVDFLRDLARQIKPDRVICIGDEIDAHAWSRFPRNPKSPGPAEEIRLAVRSLQDLYKLFPCVQVCHSNHTIRPYKRAAEIAIPEEFFRSIASVLEAPPGWTWHEWIEIEDVLFLHGEGYTGQNGAVKAAQQHRSKVVMGHIHAWGGVTHLTGRFDRIWAMNVGCLIDIEAFAFEYGKNMAVRPTLGTGVILDGIPQFVPLPQ